MQTGVDVSRILPPRVDEGEPKGTSLRIPELLLRELDAIARETNYTRTDVVIHFLRWAIQEYRADSDKKPGKR